MEKITWYWKVMSRNEAGQSTSEASILFYTNLYCCTNPVVNKTNPTLQKEKEKGKKK